MILIVRHTVRDYAAWKPVFDEGEGLRTEYGLLSHTIYRTIEDPNDLTLEFQIESRERAQRGSCKIPSWPRTWSAAVLSGAPCRLA